jgi:hypothetical protein
VSADPQVDPNGYSIIFLHGNQGNIASAENVFRILRGLGFQILAIDYRGFGNSEGQPSEQGLYEDAHAAFDYLVYKRLVPPDRIVVYGHSLGAAVAIELAADRRPAGLIVQAGFTSLAAVGQEMFRFLPVSLMSRQRFDSESRIGNVKCAKLFLYGRADHLVPPEMGQKLLELAPPPKTWVLLNGDHDVLRTDEAGYVDALRSFVQQLRQAAAGARSQAELK